jgi:hypothetical protein
MPDHGSTCSLAQHKNVNPRGGLAAHTFYFESDLVFNQ